MSKHNTHNGPLSHILRAEERDICLVGERLDSALAFVARQPVITSTVNANTRHEWLISDFAELGLLNRQVGGLDGPFPLQDARLRV